MKRNRSGFTLVELLVVIAIIGVLVGLLLPAVQSAREAARRSQCLNNLKQIGVALTNYESAHQHYPFGAHDADCELVDRRIIRGKPMTWRILILPYLEQQAIFDDLSVLIDQSEGTSCYPKRPFDRSPLWQYELPAYICPSEAAPYVKDGFSAWGSEWAGPREAAISSYFGSAGPVATGPNDYPMSQVCGLCSAGRQPDALCPCFFGNRPGANRGFYHGHSEGGPGMLDMWPNEYSTQDVPDGTSNVFFVGETHWAESRNGPGCAEQMQWMSSWSVASTVWGINADTAGGEWWGGCNFRSRHPGGAQFLRVDGSVDFLQDAVDLNLLANLATRNDGLVGNERQPPEE